MKKYILLLLATLMTSTMGCQKAKSEKLGKLEQTINNTSQIEKNSNISPKKYQVIPSDKNKRIIDYDYPNRVVDYDNITDDPKMIATLEATTNKSFTEIKEIMGVTFSDQLYIIGNGSKRYVISSIVELTLLANIEAGTMKETLEKYQVGIDNQLTVREIINSEQPQQKNNIYLVELCSRLDKNKDGLVTRYDYWREFDRFYKKQQHPSTKK